MDNIVLKKLWSDDDFYEAEILFYTNNVNCKVITYLTKDEINLLSDEIADCIISLDKRFVWEIGEPGSASSPKIKLELTDIDKQGYVFFDVYCDVVSDKKQGNYYCKFPIVAELGLLKDFAEKLILFNEEEVETVICLSE